MAVAVIDAGDGSGTNWLGTVRALGRKGVEVIRLSPKKWYASKYCSTMICPDAREEPRRYLASLRRLGKTLYEGTGRKHALFPTSDDGLSLISKNIETLSGYFEAVCPGWEVTEKIIDKSKTYEFAEKLGIPVPETFTPTDYDDVTRIAKTIPYPCLIKPTHSHLFSPIYKVKLFKVMTAKDLLRHARRLLSCGVGFVLQEEVPGPDDPVYSFRTSVNRRSEPLAVFTSRKLRQWPPQFGVGSCSESVWEPRIVDVGVRMLREMGFYGIATFEFKKDRRTKEFKLLEINGRSGSQNYLTTLCGVNTPFISYKEAIGEHQEPLRSLACGYRLGVKWVHLTIDVMSLLKKRSAGEITLSAWGRSLLTRNLVFGILSLEDPLPSLSELRKYSIFKLHSFLKRQVT
jgi:predicted ATP-grasp superfamily ATP-dependent carboligase